MSRPKASAKPSLRAFVATIGFGLVLSSLASAETPASRFADPTRPPLRVQSSPVKVSAENPKWTLASVLISPERRIAIINGVSVRQGDRVDGALVLSITRDAVTLEGPLGRLDLSLHPNTVKRDTEVPDE